MKFDLTYLPEGSLDQCPKVGDVYPAQGGRPTVAWVVVSVTESGAHLLGIDREGGICSTNSYGKHVLEGRPRIGFCQQIAEMVLAVNNIDTSRSSRGKKS